MTLIEMIDSRIRVDCISCPPDEHLKAWLCAWRFYIPKHRAAGFEPLCISWATRVGKRAN